MCKTTDGTPCPCSETSATTKPKKRRTCATPDCGRVSGDAKFCRKCRAEVPWRAEVARLTAQHDDLVVDAKRLRTDLLAVAQHRDRLECERYDAITKRDEATKALGTSRGIARGQEVRLKRAKAQRDAAVAALARLAGLDHMEEPPRVVDCEAIIRHELHERLELANRHRVERDAATATVGQLTEQIWELTTERQAMLLDGIAKDGHANDLLQQRDDARGELGVARKESAGRLLRFRVACGVAVLLGLVLGAALIF